MSDLTRLGKVSGNLEYMGRPQNKKDTFESLWKALKRYMKRYMELEAVARREWPSCQAT